MILEGSGQWGFGSTYYNLCSLRFAADYLICIIKFCYRGSLESAMGIQELIFDSYLITCPVAC